ncbi:MAG: 30S ribosomal protein S3 [Clostridia bacterium]|jgi:small subunit ribosomal protein S3|nr:30S ribosomal protein S3 [Clostridia bacterium]
MGQKVNPHGARVGVIMDWSTKWYAGKKDFSKNLILDYDLRNWLKNECELTAKGKVKLYEAGISHIDIARAGDKLDISIWVAKPGIVIGQGGAGVEELKNLIAKRTGTQNINLNILEVKNPECDAQLVAENIAQQIEKRVSFRRAMKQALQHALKAGAKGIKTSVAGRLGGADIARSEGYHEGSIPLQTLRANIDYGFCEAHTTYGRIGVKVWIYKGQFLGKGYAPRSIKATGNERGDRRDRRNFNREDRRPRDNQQPREGGK